MTTAYFNKYNTNSIVEIDAQIQGWGSRDIQIYREEGGGGLRHMKGNFTMYN